MAPLREQARDAMCERRDVKDIRTDCGAI